MIPLLPEEGWMRSRRGGGRSSLIPALLNRQAPKVALNPDAVRRFNSACSNGRNHRRSTRGRLDSGLH